MKYGKTLFLLFAFALSGGPPLAQAEEGITENTIFFGSILPLSGRAQALGKGMKAGLDSSLNDRSIGARHVFIRYLDDLYEPKLTHLKVRKLQRRGIFAMIGNVGTPTAAVSLPMLKRAGIPAIGFFTGAGLLRTGEGPVLNYRASYVQETAAVIEAALEAGLKPENVCAYVQNDAYGKAGLVGMQKALEKTDAPLDLLSGLQTFFEAIAGEELVQGSSIGAPVNPNGPVGVYIRNTQEVIPGYQALKNWEKKSGYTCKLVITVGAYDNIAHFVQFAREKGENWVISAVSFTGADAFAQTLQELGVVENNLIMSQVVPLLDSSLPIVREARDALGQDFGFVSLEGYIVGKMTLRLLQETPAPLTRKSFVAHARQSKFDLGGVKIDFTRNGYQASDLVIVSYLSGGQYRQVTPEIWQQMLNWQPDRQMDTQGMRRP